MGQREVVPHQRPLNLQFDRGLSIFCCIGSGQSTSIPAAIAAASSSVGAGWIVPTIGEITTERSHVYV